MNAPTRTLAGLVAALVLAHCNAQPASTGHSAAAVMGGTTDNTDTGVVGIVVQTSAGIATCSGSLTDRSSSLYPRHPPRPPRRRPG